MNIDISHKEFTFAMEYFYKWHSILSPLKIGMLEWVTYGGDERMLMYTLSLNDTYVILNIYSIQQRQVLFYVPIFVRSLVYTIPRSFSMWFLAQQWIIHVFHIRLT